MRIAYLQLRPGWLCAGAFVDGSNLILQFIQRDVAVQHREASGSRFQGNDRHVGLRCQKDRVIADIRADIRVIFRSSPSIP